MRPRLCLALVALSGMPVPALAAATVGQPAPDFTATDSDGHAVHLAALHGRTVVLEWTNDGCPFVRKWYGIGSMQKLQQDATRHGAVWLSVISSGPGEQGFADGARADALTAQRHAAPTHVLLDPGGSLGHLYGASTTPDSFVVTPSGVLAYAGGADSVPSTDPADLARAEPCAREAITAALAGKPVAHAVTRPYGCSVKYTS